MPKKMYSDCGSDISNGATIHRVNLDQRVDEIICGMNRGARMILICQGVKKFGNPDKMTLKKLRRLSSVKHFGVLAERMLVVSSWKELLAP